MPGMSRPVHSILCNDPPSYNYGYNGLWPVEVSGRLKDTQYSVTSAPTGACYKYGLSWGLNLSWS